MTEEPTYTCAVWYLDDHGQINYDLFPDEADAANCAVGYDGNGTVLGLQWADGQTVPARQWPAFAYAKRREAERWQQRRDNPPPPTPTRLTRDPFTARAIAIETTEPDWLGERRG